MVQDNMSDYYINNYLFKNLMNSFSKEFKKAFLKIKPTNIDLYTELIPHIFRKWYYSSIAEKPGLSPAAIVNSHVLNTFGRQNMLIPFIKINMRNNKYTGIDYSLKTISLKDHYVIYDLRKLVEICSPDVEVYEDNKLVKIITSELYEDLTLKDYNYITYLTAVAFDLKLLKRMPSIHTFRAFVPDAAYNFFELSAEDQLKNIVRSSINMYSNELHDLFLPFGNMNFRNLISSLLTDSCSIQKVYEKLFSIYGISLKAILEDDEDTYYDLKESISIGLFFLGVITEIWFICPFGYYLQFIQPFYEKPFDMAENLSFINNQSPGINLNDLFLTPCDYYDLTPLGEDFFINGLSSRRTHFISKDFRIEDYFRFFR